MNKITIPATAPSANLFYSGLHPMKRKKLVERWHSIVAGAVRAQGLRPYQGEYPVVVTCRTFFRRVTGKRRKRFDADNIFPGAKLVLDGLVLAGILENDSPLYVSEVRLIAPRWADTERIEVEWGFAN